ncbi:MAG: PorP/SprF family type IX secretion system membrane protein [Bacteroidota bacterium]
MFRYNFLTVLLLLLSRIVVAQDPHFSFFSSNALAVNPGLVGQVNTYSSRIQLSYRHQWSTVLDNGAFKTAFGSFEHRICLPLRNTFLGLGASFIGDERGDFPLKRADAFGAASLIVLLSDNSQSSAYLSAGIEGGWVFHKLGPGKLTFDEQFDDPDLPPEVEALSSSSEADMGIGAVFTFAKKPRATGVSAQVGMSIKHLTKPPLSFYQLPDEITPRLEHHYVYHGAALFKFSKKIAIPAQLVYRVQRPHRQVLTSLGLEYTPQKDWRLQFATGLRLARGIDGFRSDALVPRFSVLNERTQFTASYDINISGLQNASSAQGGLELQLTILFNDDNDDCKIVFCHF